MLDIDEPKTLTKNSLKNSNFHFDLKILFLDSLPWQKLLLSVGYNQNFLKIGLRPSRILYSNFLLYFFHFDIH